jgi:hypothetical protein
LFEGRTPDGGATWTWTGLTADSTFDNIRPIVPRWDSTGTMLLWLRGTYRTYTDYDLDVVGLLLDGSRRSCGRLRNPRRWAASCRRDVRSRGGSIRRGDDINRRQIRGIGDCDHRGVNAVAVALEQDGTDTLAAVGAFLRSDPVQHNLVLTLLEARAAHPESGRYAWVRDGDEVVGVSVQSPLILHAAVTDIPPVAIDAVVDRIASTWPDLPGVFGPADTVARFAGRWAETLGVPAAPVEGQRL